MLEGMVCQFVCEIDLPLGTDLTMSEWPGLFVMVYLLLSMVIRNVGEVGWFVHCFNLTSNSVRFSAKFDLGCFFCLFVNLTSHSARISTMSDWIGLFVVFYLLFSTVIGNVGENGLLVCL